jgi:putative PIN family toxin of toxin-antitoxin system
VRRVTADSNIFISAFLRGGKPLELLDLARAGQIDLAVTDAILDEIGRVFATKFRVSAQDIQEFREEIIGFAKRVSPSETLDVVKADSTDDRILECAVAAGSEVVVSGDKHLLDLGSYRGIKIVRLSDFLAQV